jgi:hypothetical protein
MVMATATPLTEPEKDNLMDADGFPDWDYMPGEDSQPFEYKASDWGWFGGRLVALDYSTPAFRHSRGARCANAISPLLVRMRRFVGRDLARRGRLIKCTARMRTGWRAARGRGNP